MKKACIWLYVRIRSILLRIACLLHWHPQVLTIEESLDFILKHEVSLSRFGDGEILLMEGYDIKFQPYSEELQSRLIEVASIPVNRLSVGIPNIFHNKSNIKKDVIRFINSFLFLGNGLSIINKYFNKNTTYLDTNMTRFYEHFRKKTACALYVEKWKKVWQNRNILLIEGKGSRLGLGNDLFDNSKKITRIICPAEDAFARYEEILNAAKKHAQGNLIMIALGPTATVLAYDLAKMGIQAIDVGHIDIEYEWFRMKATQKVNINGRYINETNQREVSDCSDDIYLSQILDIIE